LAAKIRSFDWLKQNGAFFNFSEQAFYLIILIRKRNIKITDEIQYFVFDKSKSDFSMTFELKSVKNRI